MRILLLRVRIVVSTSNMKIHSRRLADVVKKLLEKACHTCSTIYFSLFNQSYHWFVALSLPFPSSFVKGAKYEIQKHWTCHALFRCKFWVDVSRFSPCVINLSRNNKICCRLKKCSELIGWFAWCRSNMAAFAAWQVVSSMNDEQQSQNLLLKVGQRSTFLKTFLRDKLITQGEKQKTSTQTCNETMLRDKLRVFVSCISPRLRSIDGNCNENLTWNSTFGK